LTPFPSQKKTPPFRLLSSYTVKHYTPLTIIVSRRLRVAAVARKTRSSSLCDLEKGCSSLVSSREVFFSPTLLLSYCNMIFLVIELISLFEEINNWTYDLLIWNSRYNKESREEKIAQGIYIGSERIPWVELEIGVKHVAFLELSSEWHPSS